MHGSSASGASLYLEPMTTVELNNDVVALVEREKEEIRRILLALTNAFRLRADELEALVDVAADLDELYAKARLAVRVDGVAPDLTTDGRIEFKGARHPLLIPAVREKTEGIRRGRPRCRGLTGDPAPDVLVVVSSDLHIVPPTRALVISGPNTGGKTVALKAFGLLALMAQAGLLIPVEPGSRFTPFQSVFADIGDEQSIAASLSTFSAHIAQHRRDRTRARTAGARPARRSRRRHRSGRRRRARRGRHRSLPPARRLVVATTHDDALKSYAATTEGVEAAAFGFNPETYAPTYRLIYGAPGRSLALEIAERLGMPAGVIADARARRSGRESHSPRISRVWTRNWRPSSRRSSDGRRANATVAAERRALHRARSAPHRARGRARSGGSTTS